MTTHKKHSKGQIIGIRVTAYRTIGEHYSVTVCRQFKNGKRVYAYHYIPTTSSTIYSLLQYVENNPRTWKHDITWGIVPELTFRMRK